MNKKQININEIENGYLVATPAPANQVTFANAQQGQQVAVVHYCEDLAAVAEYIQTLS